jgi:hypothetical protein
MVAEEVFANCYIFNSIRVKHASIHVKKYRGYQTVWKGGRSQTIEPSRAKPQFRFAAPRSQSRKKYFRLRNTAKQGCGNVDPT